jgi:tRNA(Ile)-lysidine synthase
MADVRRAVRENWAAAGVVSGELVLVACSGGADSLALAAASVFEGDRAGIRVGAVIVEHGLQEQTARLSVELKARLEGLGLNPVEIRAVQVAQGSGTGGTEAAARDARYAALNSAAQALGAKFVSLGHTLNDQAETVLLGLTRGSGPRSIAGMEPIDGLFLRPLLSLSRETTEGFCNDSGLDFWVDPHNSDPSFTRVRIRRTVIPLLETQLGPGVTEALARTADLLREDLELLDHLAAEQFRGLATSSARQLDLPTDRLLALHPALRSRVILLALNTFKTGFSKTHIDAVAELVTNWHGQKELALPGVRVVRHGNTLAFKTPKTFQPGAC